MAVMEALFAWLDFIGIVAFAMTGCLVAARKGLDIISFIVLGTVTGIGGGTIRDLVLNKTPVFWVVEPLYLVICLVTAAFMFVAAQKMDRFRIWIVWADALGLSVFAVVGTQIATEMGAGLLVSVSMGVVTAVFGGIMRDVLAGEPSLVMRKEVYATAAVAGALAAYGSQLYWPEWSMVLGVIVAFLIRAAGIVWHVNLPGYNWRNEE